MGKILLILNKQKEIIEVPKYIIELWNVLGSMCEETYDIELFGEEWNKIPNHTHELYNSSYDTLHEWIQEHIITKEIHTLYNVIEGIETLVLQDFIDKEHIEEDVVFGVDMELLNYA